MKKAVSIVSTAIAISAVSCVLLCTPTSAYSASLTDIVALQAKANQADRRNRCFLYAELVSQLIEQAGEQFNSGDPDRASDTLKQAQRDAEEIRLAVGDDSKRLKNAELLMERSSHRLNDMLHGALYEDRPVLETTLKQLNQLQTQLMIQVFKK